jgi:sterol desaturase/sphingolipid hydroxylase (fatty acid hydroxylase superfamily)
MLGIPIALAVSNIAEWLIHKHVLHEQGRIKGSFWSFHWHEHHRNARANGFNDPDYERPVLAWNAQGKEAIGLVGMSLAVTPLFPIAPFFVLTSYYTSYRYYRIHKKAHQNPEWARKHVPWHYDHHMGPNQDANWCVTHPWFDNVMGTRETYAGTERERADIEKREQRLARAAG